MPALLSSQFSPSRERFSNTNHLGACTRPQSTGLDSGPAVHLDHLDRPLHQSWERSPECPREHDLPIRLPTLPGRFDCSAPLHRAHLSLPGHSLPGYSLPGYSMHLRWPEVGHRFSSFLAVCFHLPPRTQRPPERRCCSVFDLGSGKWSINLQLDWFDWFNYWMRYIHSPLGSDVAPTELSLSGCSTSMSCPTLSPAKLRGPADSGWVAGKEQTIRFFVSGYQIQFSVFDSVSANRNSICKGVKKAQKRA